MKCIVLCGGAGTRMLPLSLKMQKGMIPVNGQPILRHIVNYWREHCKDFVFVVNYRKDDIVRYLPELGVPSRVVEIDRLRGIADGIYQTRAFVDGPFSVVLGDCVCGGGFEGGFPDGLGIAVCETDSEDAIRRSYSVELDPREPTRVARVVEKPTVLVNNLCGMGFYFLDPRVFGYIERTPPSALRNEVEITDVIQRMIEADERVRAFRFTGRYVNITYPDDIRLAEAFLK